VYFGKIDLRKFPPIYVKTFMEGGWVWNSFKIKEFYEEVSVFQSVLKTVGGFL
jgi:hypothetical protein